MPLSRRLALCLFLGILAGLVARAAVPRADACNVAVLRAGTSDLTLRSVERSGGVLGTTETEEAAHWAESGTLTFRRSGDTPSRIDFADGTFLELE